MGEITPSPGSPTPIGGQDGANRSAELASPSTRPGAVPSCDACNGACCRWLFIGKPQGREAQHFLAVRGARDLGDGRLAVPSPCAKLAGSRCSIYESRPSACRQFKVGGRDCLLARKLEGL